MATEIELKLDVPSSSTLHSIMQLPWLQKVATGAPKQHQLVSVYFDTKTLKLRDHGMTLRVRRDGRERVQTIKANCSDQALGRGEWEQEIHGDGPELEFAQETPLASLLTRKVRKQLRPVFETDVERVVIPIHVGESDIELALDQGRINTSDGHAEISEIEIELKNGKRSDAISLAKRLAKGLPIAYGARAKAERGYALLEGELDQPVHAGETAIDEDASTAEAFASIGLECLHHIASNERAVRHKEPEGVHQMRVGLRRLRAAMSFFKDMLNGPETDALKDELKWLTEQLGPARDYDVLVAEGVAPLREREPAKSEIETLEADLKKRRSEGFAKASAAIESERYRKLVLRTALWLLGGEWRTSNDALMTALRDRPIVDFAGEEMERRSDKIIRKIKRLYDLKPMQRHKLRIAVKKIRYARRFFSGLPGIGGSGKSMRRFDDALKDLQTTLGKLNDISVHEQLADDYAHPQESAGSAPPKAYAMGYLTGREKTKASEFIAAAAKAGKQMAKAAPF